MNDVAEAPVAAATSRVKVKLTSLRDLYGGMDSPFDLSQRGRASCSMLRPRAPAAIRPPLVQVGEFECPPIRNFEFSEVSVVYLPRAIVTHTGAVVYDDRYLIEETLEGDYTANGLTQESDEIYLDGPISEVDEDVFNINKYGTFNYSIFMAEMLPRALVGGLAAGTEAIRTDAFFPEFMPKEASELRLQLLSLMGFGADRIVRRRPGNIRYRGVIVVKVNDRYKNHRVSQVMPMMSGLLTANFAERKSRPQRRIYVSRQQSGCRRITNFDRLKSQVLDEHGFVPVSLDTMSLGDQVNLFAKAEIVLAEHGAGLVNAIFMRPGSIMVEVFPRPMIGRSMYRLIAAKFGIDYFFGSVDVPADWKWNRDDLEVDEDVYHQLLDRL